MYTNWTPAGESVDYLANIVQKDPDIQNVYETGMQNYQSTPDQGKVTFMNPNPLDKYSSLSPEQVIGNYPSNFNNSTYSYRNANPDEPLVKAKDNIVTRAAKAEQAANIATPEPTPSPTKTASNVKKSASKPFTGVASLVNSSNADKLSVEAGMPPKLKITDPNAPKTNNGNGNTNGFGNLLSNLDGLLPLLMAGYFGYTLGK